MAAYGMRGLTSAVRAFDRARSRLYAPRGPMRPNPGFETEVLSRLRRLKPRLNANVWHHMTYEEDFVSNLPKIGALFEAYASNNVAAISDVMADDIVWRIPGHHPLAGEKHGIKEVLAFFDQLGKAGFQAQPFAIAEQGDYVIDHHRGWSTFGSGLDLTWCLVFRFAQGKIKEVTNFCSDQHRADLFFHEVYKLRPIPERLAE